MCRDRRCLAACQNQHRQNEPAGQVDVPTRVESMCWGILDMCRDHRRLTECQKQNRQNKPAGQVDIPNRVDIHVMGDPGHV